MVFWHHEFVNLSTFQEYSLCDTQSIVVIYANNQCVVRSVLWCDTIRARIRCLMVGVVWYANRQCVIRSVMWCDMLQEFAAWGWRAYSVCSVCCTKGVVV